MLSSLAMRRLPALLALALLPLSLEGCDAQACTEAGCESTIRVDYGSLTINEPYELSINPEGPTVSVTCLGSGPDAEPLPDWIECDANGFELVGELGSLTTITVAVVPVATQEAVIANALVPLTVVETLQPNGPDCPPACYVREGSTEGL